METVCAESSFQRKCEALFKAVLCLRITSPSLILITGSINHYSTTLQLPWWRWFSLGTALKGEVGDFVEHKVRIRGIRFPIVACGPVLRLASGVDLIIFAIYVKIEWHFFYCSFPFAFSFHWYLALRYFIDGFFFAFCLVSINALKIYRDCFLYFRTWCIITIDLS